MKSDKDLHALIDGTIKYIESRFKSLNEKPLSLLQIFNFHQWPLGRGFELAEFGNDQIVELVNQPQFTQIFSDNEKEQIKSEWTELKLYLSRFRANQLLNMYRSTDLRLSQPPSMFQLPPLPAKRMSVVNLFELSRNFSSRGQAWLMEKYIQQQEPVANVHGVVPHTPVPTITNASRGQSAPQQDKVSSGMNSNQSQINSLRDPGELDAEMEMEME
ncbi:unnamed protein product [Mytilus edulis]|uniref:Uncharacterized protein n=1 Tax=Mytilus edulis TaxID=6550 RepID=A0A8S3PP20_MYTED|nr:unnamed protein product [Mytilus edulis]